MSMLVRCAKILSLVLKSFSIEVIEVATYEIMDHDDPTSDYQSKKKMILLQSEAFVGQFSSSL